MKAFTQFILILCLSFWCLMARSQNVRNQFEESLPVLNIVNDRLYNILDSLIINDRKCDFYDSNLVYTIHIKKEKYFDLIQFSSNHKLIKLGKELGCFTYNNHTVLVSGDNNEKLFRITKRKVYFKYYKPSGGIDARGNVIIDIYEDDTNTQWNYKYVAGALIKL